MMAGNYLMEKYAGSPVLSDSVRARHVEAEAGDLASPFGEMIYTAQVSVQCRVEAVGR